MLEIRGKYAVAKIVIDDVEETALNQIYNIVNNIITKDQEIVVLFDVHAGAGNAVVGMTMTLGEKITPALCGVDIGCGVLAVCVGENFTTNKDKLLKFEEKIRNVIPMGNNIQERSAVSSKYFEKNFPWKEANDLANSFLVSYNKKFGTNFTGTQFTYKWFLDKQKEIGMKQDAELSIGTLGGGNHFISIEKGVTSNTSWLIIHCGSRNFGLKVCEHHMKIAKKVLDHKRNVVLRDKISEIKSNFSGEIIPIKIKEAKKELGIDFETNTNGMEYLEEQYAMNYFMDMIFSQKYAQFNRSTIVDNILKILGEKETDRIESVHNYIDFSDMIIRKGAIRSYIGEGIIVPISMAYGSFLCTGKSNPDYNYSCGHGAGRVKSRGEASRTIDMKDFEFEMKGIVSTSVVKGCLDEAPQAYKNPKIIEAAIEPTATIIERVKPLLNLKDKGETMSWKERKAKEKKDKSERLNRRDMRRMRDK